MNVKLQYEILHILNCGCEVKYVMSLAVIKAICGIAYIEA